MQIDRKDPNPDTRHEHSEEQPILFEDLTERCALKLTSLLRVGGEVHYRLFERAVFDHSFRKATGLASIIYRMELEATDTPLVLGSPATVYASVEPGHSGSDDRTRIISRGTVLIFGRSLESREPVPAAKAEIHHVFTRPFAPPAERRVTRLDPRLGFNRSLPEREIEFIDPDTLLDAPEGFDRLDEEDGEREPHYWPYSNTDPNQHVHAMDYVGFAMTYATDRLARCERAPTRYFFNRARIVYRRPFFTGDPYHRRGQCFEKAAAGSPDSLCFAGAFYRSEGTPAPDESPSVAMQFFTAPKPHGRLPGAS